MQMRDLSPLLSPNSAEVMSPEVLQYGTFDFENNQSSSSVEHNIPMEVSDSEQGIIEVTADYELNACCKCLVCTVCCTFCCPCLVITAAANTPMD